MSQFQRIVSSQLPGEPLDLGHRDLLQKKLSPLGNGLSEYCFSNLYLFRQVHHYRILENHYPFVSGTTYDGFSALMPLFDLADTTSLLLREILQPHDCYYPISEPDLTYFNSDDFDCSFNPDDSDYVYAAETLQSYPGRKLAAKKNLLRQFLKNHSPTCLPLSEQTAPDAVSILDQWLKDVHRKPSATDYKPCLEAIHKLDELELFGTIYYDNQNPIGFLIARELVPGMCAINFAKGHRSIKGIFQYMFQHFANRFCDQFQWINFEQDLGIPNFRKTKRSYHPDHLLKKYRVHYKNR